MMPVSSQKLVVPPSSFTFPGHGDLEERLLNSLVLPDFNSHNMNTNSYFHPLSINQLINTNSIFLDVKFLKY